MLGHNHIAIKRQKQLAKSPSPRLAAKGGHESASLAMGQPVYYFGHLCFITRVQHNGPVRNSHKLVQIWPSPSSPNSGSTTRDKISRNML